MTAVATLDAPPQWNESVPTAVSKFAHTPELLFCLADNIPKCKSLLFKLCLVSRTFYRIFKPVLWRDMCQGDFFAKDSLNRNSDTENLRYMRTYDDGMDGTYTYDEFNYWGIFSQAPNLELAAFEPAYEELLRIVRDKCPKIRGLHLEMCEQRPEIPPALFDEFSNLTHLVLDGFYIENYEWTWGEQAKSLAKMLIRSPQMRKFGLRDTHDVEKPYVFVLISEAFAKMDVDGTKRLRLHSLLLDRKDFPPSSTDGDSADPGRFIEQLTDPRYLEHLHLGGAGLRCPPYDEAQFEEAFGEDGEDPEGELQMVTLPSFIGPNSTPNLRLLSTHTFNPYVSDWLHHINTSHPEFANQLSFSCRPTIDHSFHDQLDLDCGVPGTMDDFFLSFIEGDNGPKPDVSTTTGTGSSVNSFNFRSVVLTLTWSHLPSRNRELYVEQHTPYRQIISRLQPSPSDPTRDTLREMTLFLLNRDIHVPYPLPEHPEQVPADLKDDPKGREEYEASISMVKCNHKMEQRTREPLSKLYWRGGVTCISSHEAWFTLARTIIGLFDDLKATTIRALYIPLLTVLPGNADVRLYPLHLTYEMSAEELETWNICLIQHLSGVGNLPALRYVKIYGPAYEIIRGADGEVVRILRLGRLEEMEIELFRDVWGFGWWC